MGRPDCFIRSLLLSSPKVLLLFLLLLTVVGDSALWVQILLLACVAVGWSYGPVYRKVGARRARAA